ncbi:hypothetical protein BSK55_28700 [Paenibacillus odorifer]|nr:hypothetical protein BSK55_28700 [Paenibacillus odorifer]
MDGNDSPDGVRFWVNGQLIIDQWVTQESELTSLPISLLADQNYEIRSTVQLVAGNQYDIRIEYFGNLTGAAIGLLWESLTQAKEFVPQSQLYPPVEVSGVGLKGEYYDNINLTDLK